MFPSGGSKVDRPISIWRPVWTGGQFVTDPGNCPTHPDCARLCVLQISIYRGVCIAPKPPLPKGRCPEGAEGFAVTYYEFALDFGEFVLLAAQSPSQKSVPKSRFLTAPFRQGGLWCAVNSPTNRNLKCTLSRAQSGCVHRPPGSVTNRLSGRPDKSKYDIFGCVIQMHMPERKPKWNFVENGEMETFSK